MFHNLGNLGRGEPLQVSALAHVLRLIARWRRPRLPTNIVLVVSTIAGLALAGTAIAQPARNADSAAQDDRSDRIQAEENSIDDANSAAQDRQAAPAAAPKKFYVRINLPRFYNSNAEEFQPHGSSALEGNPQLELGWGRSFTTLPLKLAVKGLAAARAEGRIGGRRKKLGRHQAAGDFRGGCLRAEDCGPDGADVRRFATDDIAHCCLDWIHVAWLISSGIRARVYVSVSTGFRQDYVKSSVRR